MALEFNCPYCQAIIRVPDASAGKRGRCPKCATKISIPKVGAARKPSDEAPLFPAAFEPEPAAPPAVDEDDVVFEEYDPTTDVGLEADIEAELAPGDIAIPAIVPQVPPEMPRLVVHVPDSVMSKGKRRPRRSGWLWVIAAGVIVGGGGLAGFAVWYQQQTTLEGQLAGQLVEGSPLPAKIIPKSEIDMPAADAGQIFERLERTPVPLISNIGLATVHFQANEQGLVISVAPGSATSLYRVPIDGDPKLRDWLREHETEFERVRQEDVAIAANQLFRTLKRFYAKQAPGSELGNFRDSVGLAGSVYGLGHFVQAVHQRQIYPCVYQDDEALYFLLPAGVKRFEIQGKARAKSPVFFPGNFDVEIKGTFDLYPSDPASEPEEPEIEMPAGESEEEKGV